jgi:hypothetical protein
MWHYDGTTWTSTFPHRADDPFALFGLASTGDIWGAGSETIVHHVP